MNQGGAVKQPPAREKFLERYENWEDVNQVNKLCQAQVAGKYSFET